MIRPRHDEQWFHDGLAVQEALQDREDFNPELSQIPIPIKTQPTEHKPTNINEKSKKRQSQGDRQDWRWYLHPIPNGFRLVDERSLSRESKAARTKSIKSAMAKRLNREHVQGLPNGWQWRTYRGVNDLRLRARDQNTGAFLHP